MKRIHLTAIAACALGIVASFSASATPVHATFNGSVTGALFINELLTDFPIGTAASFDVTFDDSSLGPIATTSFSVEPVSGTVKLGAYEWILDSGHITSYEFTLSDGHVNWYELQLTGTGPTIPSGASLFGLFTQFTPDLQLVSSQSLMVGFAYQFDGGTNFGYAYIDGNFAATKSTTVPEPATAFLMIPALALLLRKRRVTWN